MFARGTLPVSALKSADAYFASGAAGLCRRPGSPATTILGPGPVSLCLSADYVMFCILDGHQGWREPLQPGTQS